MKFNWRTVVASILGALCGGAAAVYGYKYYDSHFATGKNSNRVGWTPPVEEEPAKLEESMAEKEHPADSDEYDGEVSEETKEKFRRVGKKEPYPIDESEFFYGEEKYDKNRELVWYTKSRLLVDGQDEIVEEAAAILGESNLENMNYKLDGDMYYVRDDVAGADYEIEVRDDVFERESDG